MCGIFGLFSFDHSIDLRKMVECLHLLRHRGPDGFGFETGNFKKDEFDLQYNQEVEDSCRQERSTTNYFLGHRRLSIVDLDESASQPMESVDGKFSIIFNGEIYNHVELKDELVRNGSIFKTDHSDTEVLLNAYATWGVDCLSKLRGMFAFAVYDRRKKELFLARDRIGQKTIYYELTKGEFIFSSEIQPMVRHSNSSRRINLTALAYYTLLGYVPYPLSIFAGIKKMPPGSYALVDLQRKDIAIREYWDIDVECCPGGTDVEFEEKIEQYLSDAVDMRLRADVPVGAFISGGIDSTLIVKKISEISKEKFDIFGADFPQPDKSERKYIEQVALTYDQHLNLSTINMAHVKNIKGVINIFDEPFDGGSSVALYDLFRYASRQYKVILTGDGGDEMFAGYDRYREFPKKYAFFSKLKMMVVPKQIIAFLAAIGITSSKLSKLSTVLSEDFVTSYLHYNCNFSLLKMLRDNGGEDVQHLSIFDNIKEKVREKKFPSVKALQYLEIKTILPGRMLYKLDRFSMAYGVEARSPFLDHSLVEMAFAIPDEFNSSESGGKLLLKRILEKDFPKEFVHRKKQGFGNPFSAWFADSSTHHIFDILNNRESLIFKYFKYDQFHKEFPQFKKGYAGEREKEMWRFIVLANYLNNFKEVIEY